LRNKQKAWRLGAQVLNHMRRDLGMNVPAARNVKGVAAAAAPLARRTRGSLAVQSTLPTEHLLIDEHGTVNVDHATFQAALNEAGFEEGAGTCSNAAAP
jgi:hypothetical protein